MTITNGYATLADLQDWIDFSVASQTTNMENVVTSVSRWIDQYCQRQFFQTNNETRVLDSCDPWKLDLGPFNDLRAIDTLATDQGNDGTYETTWSASDYQLGPTGNLAAPEQRPYIHVRAVLGRTFPQRLTHMDREGRIQIVGDWGWPAVPQTVVQACLIQSSRVLKRRQSPEGMVGFADLGVVRMQTRLDPDVQQLLDPYRHPNVAVLVG